MQPRSFWFDLSVLILHAGSWIRYQMNPANYREALIETRLDEAEGADILMVKFLLILLNTSHIPLVFLISPFVCSFSRLKGSQIAQGIS